MRSCPYDLLLLTNLTNSDQSYTNIFPSTHGIKEIRRPTFRPNSSFKGQVHIINIKTKFEYDIKFKNIKLKTHFRKFTHPSEYNFKKTYRVSSILEI